MKRNIIPQSKTITVLESLNSGLHQAMATDDRVILIGEDLLDPYGGAFKVSKGLSTRFPERVWATPISEAGIVGIAAGMAMRGLLPVVEIMFGDFLTLAADQIINHIAKFSWMYHHDQEPRDRVTVPIVIRTPMGGRRGYGPTHSQTLEKLFLGVPGLRILAPCHLTLSDENPGNLVQKAIIEDHTPILFIENKLLYSLPVVDAVKLVDWQIEATNNQNVLQSNAVNQMFDRVTYPTHILKIRNAPPATITIVTYGYMVELARIAALRLAYEYEVFIELVIPTQLAPYHSHPVINSLYTTKRLLTIEEGTHTLGWGAEVVAQASELLGNHLLAAHRLAALDIPVPASKPLEEFTFPTVNAIIEKCIQLSKNR